MIAYGMLYAAAVGLPIFLAAFACSSALRKYGRPERGIWFAALGLALTLPVVFLMNTSGGSSPGASAIPPEAGFAAVASGTSPETGVLGLPAVVVVSVEQSGLGLDEVLMLLWLLASAILMFRWMVATRRIAKLGASWRAGILDGIRVWLTTDLGPAVSGIFRTRILVPSWLVSLPEEQRSLVLLHEEEHVKARDPALIAVTRMARILTPWNPFVWLLSSRLVRAVELDCDRRVLRRRPDVEAYGTTLLTVSSRDTSRLVAAAAFAESEAPLRKRILAMTTPPRTVSILSILTALVLGVVFLVGVFEVPIPAIRIQVDVGPPGSGVAIVEQEDVTEQRVAELEATADETDAETPSAEPAAAEVEPAPVLPASSATLESAIRILTGVGTVTGQITDASTGMSLAAGQVYISILRMGGVSQRNGRYLLEDVPAGAYTLAVTRIGYRTAEVQITVARNQTVEQNFAISQEALELDGIIISGRAGGTSRRAVSGDVSRTFADIPVGEYLSAAPVFTPMTVRPEIRNETEVMEALMREYPPLLRDEGIGGQVVVWFFVSLEGKVLDRRISQSSGYNSLDEAALGVADIFEFRPAMNRNQRAQVWIQVPITFEAQN